MTPSKPAAKAPTWRRWIAAALVAAGWLGLGKAQVDVDAPSETSHARGTFWSAQDAAGAGLRVPAKDRGFVLTQGQRIRFGPEDDGVRRIDTVRVLAERMTEASALDLTARGSEAGRVRLRLTPSYTWGLAFLREASGAAPKNLAQRTDVELAGALFQPVELSLRLAETALDAEVNRVPQLHCEPVDGSAGDLTFDAATGPVRVLQLEVSGTQGQSRFTWTDDLKALPATSAVASFAFGLGRGALAFAFAAVVLLGFCGRRPDRAALVAATLRAVTLPALACVSAWFTTSSAPHPPAALLLLLALPSFGSALFALRAALAVPTPAEPAARRVPAVVCVAVFFALTAFAAKIEFAHETARVEPLREDLRLAAAADDGRFELRDGVRLNAATHLAVRNAHRDFALDGTVALAPGAVLEVRARNRRGEGVALLLSADPAIETSFVRIEEDALTRIGTRSGAVAARDALRLRIDARGRSFEARIGDTVVARAEEDLFPRGDYELLAMTGAAEVRALTITPVESSAPDANLSFARLRAAVVPFVLALVTAVLLAFLARGSLLHGPAGLVVGAASTVPWLLTRLDGEVGEAARGGTALLAAAASTLLVFLAGMVRVRAAGVVRFYAVFAVAIGVGALSFRTLTARHWPPDVARMNAFTAVEWDGDHIEGKLLHAWHPLLRRWNPWVTDHRLRRSHHELRKPAGTRRILFLGTSSTFGYGTRDAYGALLGERLAKDPAGAPVAPVEVLIGAYPGSSGIRQFHFLEQVGLQFAPDIVCLSLYYNDAPGLTQFDEPAYLERIRAPEYRRSLFDDLRVRRAITAGEPRFTAMNIAYCKDPTKSPTWDPAWGEEPARIFEGVLRRFGALSREQGFRLVLIKEPVRGNGPRLWKPEFYAAMERVGQEFGAVVVDPSPALQRAGGASLFMDEVHPFGSGHAVMADVLEPILREELRQLDAR